MASTSQPSGDLAAASADLRAQVGSSVREFETLRTALIQALSETTNECIKASSRQVTETVSYTHLTLPTNREV